MPQSRREFPSTVPAVYAAKPLGTPITQAARVATFARFNLPKPVPIFEPSQPRHLVLQPALGGHQFGAALADGERVAYEKWQEHLRPHRTGAFGASRSRRAWRSPVAALARLN